MTLFGYILSLSPLLLFGLSFGLLSHSARKIARWASAPWVIMLLPAFWLASDCGEATLEHASCGLTPPAIILPLTTGVFYAILGWVIIGPLVMIIAGVIEWKELR